jgi:hypothetical protein
MNNITKQLENIIFILLLQLFLSFLFGVGLHLITCLINNNNVFLYKDEIYKYTAITLIGTWVTTILILIVNKRTKK